MENELVIYSPNESGQAIEVFLRNESIWLTQKQIAELFGTQIPAINKHIGNILKSNELSSESTVSKMEIVQKEGRRTVTRQAEIYNLDMIISIGYRVNSNRATQFRI